MVKLKFNNHIVPLKSEMVVIYKFLLDYIESGHNQTEQNIWNELSRTQVHTAIDSLLNDYKRRLEIENPPPPVRNLFSP